VSQDAVPRRNIADEAGLGAGVVAVVDVAEITGEIVGLRGGYGGFFSRVLHLNSFRPLRGRLRLTQSPSQSRIRLIGELSSIFRKSQEKIPENRDFHKSFDEPSISLPKFLCIWWLFSGDIGYLYSNSL